MEHTLITSDNFHTNNWSGGTSRELFIFPPTANYQQRDFKFRLSTATVQAERSDFTSLPGISRKLMILSGSITIHHEGHYSKQLNKFDMDVFEGDWKTSSLGKCTDFNLMTSAKTIGEIYPMTIKNEGSINHPIKKNCDWLFIYVNAGKVTTEINNKKSTLNNGDLLVLHQPIQLNFEVKGLESSELIFTEITEG